MTVSAPRGLAWKASFPRSQVRVVAMSITSTGRGKVLDEAIHCLGPWERVLLAYPKVIEGLKWPIVGQSTPASNSLQSNCRVSHTTIHDVLYWVSNECDHLIGRTRVPPKKTHQSETSSADPPPHKHTSLVGTNRNSNMTSRKGAILEPLPPCAPSPSCKQIRREKL